MTKKPVNTRLIAAIIIADWLKTGNFPDRALSRVTNDRAFITELVYGSVRRKESLKWCINQFIGKDQEWFILSCLMVGTYQLIFMDNVETYAAINETVEAVKTENPHAAGFVNGVLRNCQRKTDELKDGLRMQPLAIRESHPEILVQRWTRNFGAEKCADLCTFNNNRPETIIIPNILKTTIDDYLALLKENDIDARLHPLFPDICIILPRGISPAKLPGFDDGLFSVQDPSTLNSIALLDPQPGETVLDACAAPGGKAILIAQKVGVNGNVIAMDLHEDRLAILEENAKRMDTDNISIVQGDASSGISIKKANNSEKYHKILLDVPCTNTGVLRRRPDARWRFSEKRLKELAILQDSMLNSASQFLAPGGTLVYSTCSLEPEEGEQLIEKWLKTHSEFELKKQVFTWPPETGSDGTFAASIVRK